MKIILFIIAVLLTGCQFSTPTPIPSPEPTNIVTPSLTPAPTGTVTPSITPEPSRTPTLMPTATKVPTETPVPVNTSDEIVKPLSIYKGIPIMPGAISGREETDQYTFVIVSTPQEVKAYYAEQLSRLGYLCMLNAFEETKDWAGLMCPIPMPMITIIARSHKDGKVEVSIIVSAS